MSNVFFRASPKNSETFGIRGLEKPLHFHLQSAPGLLRWQSRHLLATREAERLGTLETLQRPRLRRIE